jgi:hypothetical protein
MALQLFGVLRRPAFAMLSLGISLSFALLFLYSDSFIFFSPRFVVYVPLESAPYLILDLVISALSGIAISGSIYQLRFVSYVSSKNAGTGLAGMLAAVVAGACPCMYLVPLLALAGGAGGVLGALGIFLYNLQIPIKLLSLAILGFVLFTLERSLVAYCRIPLKSQPLQ